MIENQINSEEENTHEIYVKVVENVEKWNVDLQFQSQVTYCDIFDIEKTIEVIKMLNSEKTFEKLIIITLGCIFYWENTFNLGFIN